MKLFNTLSREKEIFIPIEDKKVRLYSCGPTVYGRAHIGNLRAYTLVDLLKRVLKANGYEITHIMNITDVGHLSGDGDLGADKMEKSASELKKTVWDIAQEYTDIFVEDLRKMHIEEPQQYTKATDYIPEQIEMVKVLEAKGYTYKTSDGVYFDTSLFPDYGKMARLDIEGLEAGSRVEFNPEKKNLTDFALWKFSNPEDHRQMEWESPWGTGFPGWHIECSAMSTKTLGNHFDIHTGGVDHIPVHHTNEIAQSECATGEKFVNYWLHNEFIQVNEEKMAKSLGNVFSLQTLEENNIQPLAYKFFVLQTHYRKKLNFTFDAVKASQEAYNKIVQCKKNLEKLPDSHNKTHRYKKYEIDALSVLNDDLNSPQAIALLFDFVREVNQGMTDNLSLKEDALSTLEVFNTLLGLGLETVHNETIPENILALAKQREIARNNKDWSQSDLLRDQIISLGYSLEDTKEGQKIQKI